MQLAPPCMPCCPWFLSPFKFVSSRTFGSSCDQGPPPWSRGLPHARGQPRGPLWSRRGQSRPPVRSPPQTAQRLPRGLLRPSVAATGGQLPILQDPGCYLKVLPLSLEAGCAAAAGVSQCSASSVQTEFWAAAPRPMLTGSFCLCQGSGIFVSARIAGPTITPLLCPDGGRSSTPSVPDRLGS